MHPPRETFIADGEAKVAAQSAWSGAAKRYTLIEDISVELETAMRVRTAVLTASLISLPLAAPAFASSHLLFAAL